MKTTSKQTPAPSGRKIPESTLRHVRSALAIIGLTMGDLVQAAGLAREKQSHCEEAAKTCTQPRDRDQKKLFEESAHAWCRLADKLDALAEVP